MQPLKINWKLADYIAEPENPLHLDGLVAWLAAERALNAKQDPSQSVLSLPFKSICMNGEKIWCASALMFKKLGVEHRHMIRRQDATYYAEAIQLGVINLPPRGLARFENVRGKFKQYSLHYPLLRTTEATAWCIGDAMMLRDLLNDLSCIGKRRRLGHGRVLSFAVEPDNTANEKWKLRDLPLARPQLGYIPVVATVRPPYWDATARRTCYRPVEIV